MSERRIDTHVYRAQRECTKTCARGDFEERVYAAALILKGSGERALLSVLPRTAGSEALSPR